MIPDQRVLRLSDRAIAAFSLTLWICSRSGPVFAQV
jgi:hypothetical protein